MAGGNSISDPALPANRQEGLLTCLQGGRAVAALLVVLYHNALYIFAKDKYWATDPAHGFFRFGHAGVAFFFVLSGFIILHIHWGDLNQRSQFLTFARKRFLRIYPIYWLVLAVIVPIYFLVPSFGFAYHRDPLTILSSALLVFLNKDYINVLPVGWTLHHEVLFYCIFSLAILLRNLGVTVLCVWLLASAASLFLPPFAFPFLFLASPLHVLFGMGMAACWLLRRRRIPAPGLLAVTGVALFLAAGIEEDYVGWLGIDVRDIIYGLGSMLALIGLVAIEREGRLHVPMWLQLTGNASYCIYLIHFSVLSLLAKIFIGLGVATMLPAIVCYILLPVLAVLCGIVLHLFIERPLLRALGRSTKHRPQPVVAHAATTL